MRHQLRPELKNLPLRMHALPIDERGYPVPAFVATLPSGERDFRFMDGQYWRRAVRDRRCWVCGGMLGSHLAFVIGPMCGINRTTSEPPCHRECAEWSAQFCPFLSRPHMIRREDELTREVHEKDTSRGCPILRNPGVSLVWMTRSYTVWKDQNLITVGDPIEVSWWAEGRLATRAEVEESIRTGFPKLMELAAAEGPEAVAALERQRAEVETLLPKR